MIVKLIFVISLFFPVLTFGQNREVLGGGSQLQPVRGLFVDSTENTLYVVGQFQEIGGIPADRVAKWNGNQWISLCDTGGVLDSNPIIEVLKHDGKLIVSGQQYDMDGEFCRYTAYLDDSIWKPYGEPNSLAFINKSGSDLFMSGFFDQLDGQSIKQAGKKSAIQVSGRSPLVSHMKQLIIKAILSSEETLMFPDLRKLFNGMEVSGSH